MTTRGAGYRDYGLTRDDVIRLKKAARDPQNHRVLQAAAEAVSPDLAEMLVRSLSHGASYDKLYRKYYVPITEGSFYGYRRKVLAEFGKRLKE